MRNLATAFGAALAAITVPAAVVEEDGKNIYDVWWGEVPASAETLLADRPEVWNFGFRPYGSASASWLWSDPIMARSTLSGEVPEGKCPTAMAVGCNADGFSVLVYTVEASLPSALAKGAKAPDGRFELYVMPGDTDSRAMTFYYQFGAGADNEGAIEAYVWSVEDRRERHPKRWTDYRVRRLANGYVHVITFSWEAFWDKLPFVRGADNFWRLGIVRFAADGGVTWGGTVHEASCFGYLRFPNFTEEQRTEIRGRLLMKGWARFQAVKSKPMYNTPRGWDVPWPLDAAFLREERAKYPETYVLYTQDPEFHDILERHNEKVQALGADVVGFAALPPERREAFYRRASDMLFNYRYDVERLYAAYIDGKFFPEEEVVK